MNGESQRSRKVLFYVTVRDEAVASLNTPPSPVLAPAGSETPTAVYAGNPTVPAALRGSNYYDTAVAQDVSATGIGLTGSVGTSSGGSYSRFVDEMRVRRGVSSADWIQANWDTQRIGTDFLSAGPVVDHLLPTLILIR